MGGGGGREKGREGRSEGGMLLCDKDVKEQTHLLSVTDFVQPKKGCQKVVAAL